MSKKEAEMNDLEYLLHSEKYLQGTHDNFLKKLKECKKDIEELKVDMKVIKNGNLKQACGQIHNSLIQQKVEYLENIRRTLVDLAHVRSIIKALKSV